MYRPISLILLLIVCGCGSTTSPSSRATYPLTTDTRNRLHEHGRPALWQATFKDLGDSGFRASVGPVTYEDVPDRDPDYYSIDIEQPGEDSSYVIFQQDFPIEDVPLDLLNAEAKDVVRYESSTRTAIFTIGGEEIRYVLPDAP